MKMYSRLPLLEEPFDQTPSGKNDQEQCVIIDIHGLIQRD